MKKLKIHSIITLLFILKFTFSSYSNNYAKFNDSILVFKSESMETIKIDSDRNIESETTKSTNYHIINFSTSEIIFFFKHKSNNWESKSFEYYSTKESPELIEFNTQSEISRKVMLDVNPYQTIVYSYTNGVILAFSELDVISNKELSKLGIYDLKDSFELVEKTKEVVINERIEDFEFSEYWRKESFKKTVDYVQKILDNQSPKCKMIRRSSYNPSNIEYIGYQGFRVKLYAEYDCNQNYINESYFWVDVYYLGHNKWNLDLIDQRLTH